jgi:hypothetical protein
MSTDQTAWLDVLSGEIQFAELNTSKKLLAKEYHLGVNSAELIRWILESLDKKGTQWSKIQAYSPWVLHGRLC